MEGLVQALAVASGAACGAIVRWLLGLWLNPQWGGFPLGTLLVNCAGGLLIGMAMVGFVRWPNDVLRLLLVTGFLGGMTTFSAYSAESLSLIQRNEWALALGHTLLHVLGALTSAGAGFWLARMLWRA